MTVEEIERRYADGVPLKRANEPEDIADMVVFLASPGARNITGQSFNVDGGLILGLGVALRCTRWEQTAAFDAIEEGEQRGGRLLGVREGQAVARAGEDGDLRLRHQLGQGVGL